MWTFVEKLSGTGSSGVITFSGLDGDTDKFYKIIGRGQASGSGQIRCLFNGATTNMTSAMWYDSSGTWTRQTTVGSIFPLTGTDHVLTEIEIFADSGDSLVRHWSSSSGRAVASSNDVCISNSRWNDTSSNITSLAMSLSTSNFTTESHFWLYKLANP